MYVTGETKCGQVIEKLGTKPPRRREVVQLVGAKVQISQIVDRLLQTGSHEKIPAVRQFPNKELENSRVVQAVVKIGL